MNLELTTEPDELGPELAQWVRRLLPLAERTDALTPPLREFFDDLTDLVVEGRYGSFAVVAHVHETHEPAAEYLPFLVPVVEELFGLMDDGHFQQIDGEWCLVDIDGETAARLGVPDLPDEPGDGPEPPSWN